MTYYREILWDWNGTLLDDRELALNLVNDILIAREMKSITMADYLEKFDHPVKDFYRGLGLGPDDQTISQIMLEFHAGYGAGYTECRLQPATTQLLDRFRQLGLGQSILSACHEQVLHQAVVHYGTREYFDALLGLGNHFAHSKLALGECWLQAQTVAPEQVLIIGDTTHDYEVAEGLGCDCILVARGHQSERKLAACGVPVLSELGELLAEGRNPAERYFGLNGRR